MRHLPVIVSMGGVGPAGRTSNFHAYRRLVVDQLDAKSQANTWQSLSALTGIEASDTEALRQATLVRELESGLFDAKASYFHSKLKLKQTTELVLSPRQLPKEIPLDWRVEELADGQVKVSLPADATLMLPQRRRLPVQSAGQLPTGFTPDSLYQSRNHPRGLQLSVFGASDALLSMGISWETVLNRVAPDQVAVYAGSALSQLDYNGFGGMQQARLLGKRVTSKQLALGMPEMAADFINAYVLGSVGTTGNNTGACASFLYNLQLGMNDIRSGRRRVVLVGNAEAPITPEVIDGFATMGALATVDGLRQVDGLSADETPDYRRACRPFAENCGFTLAEASQFTILMDDALALELGANVLGSVGDVFVNADGPKKSISAPGVGNYITMAKAVASARSIVGDRGVRQSFVQAHGTGTPQNRVSESHILSECARVFGIENWSVTAVKSYLGHSIGAAAGDQLMATLGTWQHGLLPGIASIDTVAEDVHQKGLNILTDHQQIDAAQASVAFLNSKGFGGNNASAAILSPDATQQMLAKRHGQAAVDRWQANNESVQAAASAYENVCLAGEMRPLYRFGEGVLTEQDLEFSADQLRLKGFENAVNLQQANPYADMCE